MFQLRHLGSVMALVAIAAILTSDASAATLRLPAGGDLAVAVEIAGDGDTILLDPGTYLPPSGGFWIGDTGKSLTVQAATPGTVVFSGQGQNPLIRIVNSSLGASGIFTFRDITFRDGKDNQFQLSPGLTVGRARVVIERCLFENNLSVSGSTGGAAVMLWEGSEVVIIDSYFVGNVANTEGGAIAVYDSELIIGNSRFIANRVTLVENVRTTSAGGALALLNGSILIDRSRFEGNLAGFAGGALYGYSRFKEPFATARGVFIVNNSTFIDNGFGPASPTLPDPQQGGAIHIEDQIQLIIEGSRFINNTSEAGGAVTAYRSEVVISDSIFRNNYGTGFGVAQGFAGQIGLLSGDLFSGDPNFPSGQLSVTDSLILCDLDRSVAQTGGGIFAEGDRNRTYGVGGLPKIGGPEENRAPVVIDRVAIVGCDVEPRGGLPGEGAGFEMAHVDLTMTDTIVAGADAIGGNGSGGGGRLVFESKALLDNVSFAFNSATNLGAGLVLQGSEVDIRNSLFFGSLLSPDATESEGQSFGAAIFASPILNFLGKDLPMLGSVNSSYFTQNDGLAIYDDDQVAGPVNDLRYDDNGFFESTFGDRVYRDVINSNDGLTPDELNAVVVTRNQGVPSTAKSQVDNETLSAAPVTVSLLALPPTLPTVAARDDDPAIIQSFLVYTWTGGAAELDGTPISNVPGFNGGAGIVATTTGTHTLKVGNTEVTVTIAGAIFTDGFERGDLSRWDEVSQ